MSTLSREANNRIPFYGYDMVPNFEHHSPGFCSIGIISDGGEVRSDSNSVDAVEKSLDFDLLRKLELAMLLSKLELDMENGIVCRKDPIPALTPSFNRLNMSV